MINDVLVLRECYQCGLGLVVKYTIIIIITNTNPESSVRSKIKGTTSFRFVTLVFNPAILFLL